MVSAFRDLGHSVEIVSLVATERERLEVSEEAFPAAWQTVVRRIPFAYEIVQLGYNVIGILLLFWKVLRTSPDFIYERYSLFNLTGVVVAKLLNKPIVLEVNSPLALEQGRDNHILAVEFAQWMEKVICNAATHVIVVTESLRRILVTSGVKAQQIVVMHNGVNLVHFAIRSNSGGLRRRLGLERKVVIGYVGWFRNWHGLDLLIDAFHNGRLGTRGAVLLLVGDGLELKALRQQIAKMQLDEYVILTGALPHSVVPEYLNLFDIAVQPAANEYCCPMKILEYMALGKAIVAPRQANLQELLHEEEAVFFPPGDVVGLARLLSELMAEPQRAACLGKRARNAIHDRDLLWVRNAEFVMQLVAGSSPSAETISNVYSRNL